MILINITILYCVHGHFWKSLTDRNICQVSRHLCVCFKWICFYTSRQEMQKVNRCWCVDNCLCTRYICTCSGALGQRPWYWQGNWLPLGPLGWNACAPTCLQNSVGSSQRFFFWFAVTWMHWLLKEEFMSPSIEILALGLVMCRQRAKLKKL